MIGLDEKKCIPCSLDTLPLTHGELFDYFHALNDGWKLVDDKMIEKSFRFSNFVQSLDFTNKIGLVAEQEGHHPNIFLSWGLVRVQLKTHKIDGLSENDFILASKIDNLK